jgi:predicted DCC family thiol-disulfide oxidoreductase YuxK
VETRPLHVFYDADCGFCTRSARLLRRLDRGHRLRIGRLSDAAAYPDAPPPPQLAAAMHCRDRSGRWLAGGDAWLRIAEELPALRPFGRIGRLPGARWVVERVYRLIAANRHRLSRLLGDEACETGPVDGLRTRA